MIKITSRLSREGSDAEIVTVRTGRTIKIIIQDLGPEPDPNPLIETKSFSSTSEAKAWAVGLHLHYRGMCSDVLPGSTVISDEDMDALAAESRKQTIGKFFDMNLPPSEDKVKKFARMLSDVQSVSGRKVPSGIAYGLYPLLPPACTMKELVDSRLFELYMMALDN